MQQIDSDEEEVIDCLAIGRAHSKGQEWGITNWGREFWRGVYAHSGYGSMWKSKCDNVLSYKQLISDNCISESCFI
jgi:hypothetical protein